MSLLLKRPAKVAQDSNSQLWDINNRDPNGATRSRSILTTTKIGNTIFVQVRESISRAKCTISEIKLIRTGTTHDKSCDPRSGGDTINRVIPDTADLRENKW